jgi:hypothetical protein
MLRNPNHHITHNHLRHLRMLRRNQRHDHTLRINTLRSLQLIPSSLHLQKLR